MTNNAERIGDSSEVNTEQQKHPLEQMPSFEEHMQQLKSSETSNNHWANLENTTNNDASLAVEDRQEKVELAEKTPENSPASQSEIEQSSETTSDTTMNRHKIASGEKSTIYSVEKADGKTSTRVESDYFSIAEKFTKAHDELNDNFELRLAMAGLSTDLALIDATHGKNFEDGNEKLRSNLLEDYSTLRLRLDDPNTSQEEKDLIAEYFDQMGGDALTFLEDHYTPEQAKTNNSEQGEEREKFNVILEEAKEDLEKAKKVFQDDSDTFDRTLSKINELARNHSMDIDSLQTQLSNLIRAAEDLDLSTNHFSSQNIDYESVITQGEEFLSEDDLRTRQKQVYENEDLTIAASKKLNNVNDLVAQIRRYISTVDDALTSISRL